MHENEHFLVDDNGQTFLRKNHSHIGFIEADVDGYHYWWPKSDTGSWQPWLLRALADFIDDINKPWDDEVEAYFAGRV